MRGAIADVLICVGVGLAVVLLISCADTCGVWQAMKMRLLFVLSQAVLCVALLVALAVQRWCGLDRKGSKTYQNHRWWRLMDDGRMLPYRWYHDRWDRVRGWWLNRHWRRRQGEFERTGTRYYGDGGTVHHSAELDVEVDANGRVVAVWFRCQPLPFRQADVREGRASEMRAMYARGGLPELRGVEVRDAPRVVHKTPDGGVA